MFFYNPWALPCSDYYDKRASNGINRINGNGMNSTIRLFHAAPGVPDVDVYVGDILLARGLPYEQFTPFFTIPPGQYTITVFPVNQTANPLIQTVLTIPPAVSATIAAIGQISDIGLFVIPQPTFNMAQGVTGTSGSGYIRFVHLVPQATAMDVALQDGMRVFRSVEYRNITNYVPIQPGTYTFQIRPLASEQVLLTLPNIRIEPNTVYTIYAVGLVGGPPPVEAVVSQDGKY